MPPAFWLQLALYSAMMVLSPICASYLLRNKTALSRPVRRICLLLCALVFALSFVMLILVGHEYPVIFESSWRVPRHYRQL